MEYVESNGPRAAACSTSLSKISSMTCSRSVRKRSIVSLDGSLSSRSSTDEAVLELSCNRTCAVDVLVVAVQKAAKEVWWPVNSCSPPQAGANTSYSSRNSNSRCSNSDMVSVAATFKKSSTEATSCRVALVLDTFRAPCCFVRDASYDTLVSNSTTQIRTGTSRATITFEDAGGAAINPNFHAKVNGEPV